MPVSAPPARLRTFALQTFRNVTTAELTLPSEGIVVVGDNGQGKSNLVEAIGYLRLLRSGRGARDRDCIQHGAAAFHLSASLEGVTATRVTAAVDRQGRKKVTLDGREPERLTEALDALPSVTFSPRDVDLVAGGPQERRRYLDITLALTSPRYLQALRHYRAALSRRNAALREAARTGGSTTDLAAVAAWEPALAQHGATLITERQAWVRSRSAEFVARCAAIGETATTGLRYAGTFAEDASAESLLEALQRQRALDVRRGLTQTGPHRDDLALTLDGHDLRVVGSAGQQRTAAIVLRLLEAATHQGATGVMPLLLLDDPFAELDRGRTERILALLDGIGDGQHLVCVPRADEIPTRFTRLARWTVRAGAFAPAA
ncbi:MAG: DNA replication and repair protein RecF [Gemmatimonadota bacterium]|jgi:DNA replication and repair protein RecF|nr:DNA replication and repair protein RecF [Gemmatimonadota bacterium]MDQ8150141.1 DNA replication and repair protein RecF [Gemmatimonadota bacterium]MDQ8151480.1 DNA replication and repair protein RecF [Gemmatimonadota bacterium]MDQ8174949.1 DNA replication and repair protein RecF [Gemmatimonadota bacterium]MDQ8177681.1 DNA replication and repair protein RecF [Gemmatimonadota bacterium]